MLSNESKLDSLIKDYPTSHLMNRRALKVGSTRHCCVKAIGSVSSWENYFPSDEKKQRVCFESLLLSSFLLRTCNFLATPAGDGGRSGEDMDDIGFAVEQIMRSPHRRDPFSCEAPPGDKCVGKEEKILIRKFLGESSRIIGRHKRPFKDTKHSI